MAHDFTALPRLLPIGQFGSGKLPKKLVALSASDLKDLFLEIQTKISIDLLFVNGEILS